MNKGENLPHSARVLLATYMLSIGKNVEDIVVLFHNAPDFNEKSYQIPDRTFIGEKRKRNKHLFHLVKNSSTKAFASQQKSAMG